MVQVYVPKRGVYRCRERIYEMECAQFMRAVSLDRPNRPHEAITLPLLRFIAPYFARCRLRSAS